MKLNLSQLAFNKLRVGLFFVFALVIGYFGLKGTLQFLITKNYKMREAGLLPDRLYWADKLYANLYGLDYGFYLYK